MFLSNADVFAGNHHYQTHYIQCWQHVDGNEPSPHRAPEHKSRAASGYNATWLTDTSPLPALGQTCRPSLMLRFRSQRLS